MNEPKRMFDCMDVQAANPLQDQLAGKENGAWHRYSTAEMHELIFKLAAGFLHGKKPESMTLEDRPKIGIISAGRPEWLITDLAVQMSGAVLVPVYTNSGAHELKEIFQESGVSIIFAGTKLMYDKILSFKDYVPSLQTIYTYDRVEGVLHWTDCMLPADPEAKALVKSVSDSISEDDVSTIIYTSGTTGHPKGVMLTHKNIVTNVMNTNSVFEEIPFSQRRAMSFLPLNHILEKMLSYIYLFHCISIYYAENMDTIGANLKEVSPDMFVTVPRMLEKVFERILAAGQALTGIKRLIFYRALSLAAQFEMNPSPGFFYKLQFRIADRLVFSKWRAALGGEVKAVIVGGAACPVRLERIFTAAGIVIMEGYGLTETSPVISVNGYHKKDREYGTVGEVIPDTQVKIAEDGEILCKGPQVMPGYYKHPELTAEVLDTDGWFHTGDIGEFVHGKFLKITDRKKEIFKTSGGKYVAPLPIENKMKENYLIEQMIILGAGRKYTAALIVPSFVTLEKRCKEHNIPFASQEQVVKEKRVIEMFQKIIDEYNPLFSHVEQVKKFILLPHEWTIDGGELTPTGKLKRKVVMTKYHNVIEQLYADEHLIDL
jgi:long-chain acyl-CoA synthetase